MSATILIDADLWRRIKALPPIPIEQRTLEGEQRVARLLWACLVAAGEIDPALIPVEMVLMPPAA